MSSHLRLIVGLLTLGIAILLATYYIPGVHTAGQKKDRVLKDRPWANEAIKIVKVKANEAELSLGKKHSAEDDWLRGLVVTVKNVSNKNIAFIELELHFPHSDANADEPIAGFPIWAGTPPKVIRASSKILAPYENWDLSLSDEDYDRLKRLLDKTGYPASIEDVEIVYE